MRQTELSLNKRDRLIVDEFGSKGLHMAREFNRTHHILAALASKLPEQQIMEILNVGRTAIWCKRSAYLEGRLDFALQIGEKEKSPDISLDSACRAFGDVSDDSPMIPTSITRSRRKARFLAARIERIPEAANN